jgi:hypothetical protein
MTDETAPQADKPRVRGEAAWKADCDAMDQRNAAVKREAHQHKAATAVAAVERERRLAVVEANQLRVLNEQIAARRRGPAAG